MSTEYNLYKEEYKVEWVVEKATRLQMSWAFALGASEG